MKKYAVIGDPHGCFETFKLLVEMIRSDYPDCQICVVGDIIDRGPKSAQLIEFIMKNNILSVKGNHEDMMIGESDEDGPVIRFSGIWLPNGGHETIKSYHKGKYHPQFNEDEEYTHPGLGVNIDLDMYRKHLEWMKNLPYYLEFKDTKDENGRHLLVTHSSAHTIFRAKPENRMKESNPRFGAELMWNRTTPIKPIDGIFNVFGHTPRQFKPDVTDHHANVDTGACFHGSYNAGYGRMTAIIFPDKKVYQLETID